MMQALSLTKFIQADGKIHHTGREWLSYLSLPIKGTALVDCIIGSLSHHVDLDNVAYRKQLEILSAPK